MGNSKETKERILEETTNLIYELNGDIDKITIRKIAEKSGVGVGLINHYFISKDNLIENCVQMVISNVIGAFSPALCESKEPTDITKCIAKQVIDFLMENPQVSKISIMGDMAVPKLIDNTMKTVMGFAYRIDGENEEDKKLRSFCLTAILQVAFLRKDVLSENIGIDFNNKIDRDSFIEYIVDRMGGK